MFWWKRDTQCVYIGIGNVVLYSFALTANNGLNVENWNRNTLVTKQTLVNAQPQYLKRMTVSEK